MLALSFFRGFFARRRLSVVLVLLAFAGLLAGVSEAVADEVEISNLTDVSVPLWVTGDPDIVQDVLVCVYRANTSGSNRSYGIEATGDGPGFFIKSGAQTLAYSLSWYDGGTGNPNGGSQSPLVNNVELSAQTGARINTDLPANSADCNAGSSPTAMLRITVTAANMDAAPDGMYSGTITLLLSLT